MKGSFDPKGVVAHRLREGHCLTATVQAGGGESRHRTGYCASLGMESARANRHTCGDLTGIGGLFLMYLFNLDSAKYIR